MLSIQSRGFTLTTALKQRVRERIGLILGNMGHPVMNVDVRLSDINGPRGGIDKKCQIHIRLSGYQSVTVTDIQHDMYYAIDRAASRATRTMRRRLAQNQLSRKRIPRNASAASLYMDLHGSN